MRIKPSKISGELSAIPSKSYAHRIAICNFLAGKEPVGCKNFSSNDIYVTEQCLKAVQKGERVLDCGESGSTLRFLIPLMASLGGEFEFIGHGKLMDRPNDELFSVLNAHGINCYKDKTIKLSGKLESGQFVIRGDISSQYISGLLMALASLKGDSEIILSTPLVSAPYVDITIEVLNGFGVEILKTQKGFFIKGGANFCGEVVAEGDWSNMAFFLVLGAINGDIAVSGLNFNSLQGDRAIVDIIKSAGGDVTCVNNKVIVKKSNLTAFSFDAENCPDLVPIASVLASYANGRTEIKNIERLRIKESDRIQTTIAMLKAFGIRAENIENDLIIYGGKPVVSTIDSFNDHRIAMSGAVLASCASGEHSIIKNAKAVNKSYPTFFEDFNKVGGNAYEI